MIDAAVPIKQRSLATLVVGGERNELQDPVDVAIAEPGFEQALGRSAPDEALGARAGVDAPRLDSDHAPNAIGRRRRDPDQLRDLLCRQAGDRRLALERVLRLDPHLRAQCVLTLDDVARDVLCERLDEEGFADHDLVDRLAEQLGKARHVHAFLARLEIDGAGDLGGKGLLVPLVPDPDRLLHPGHPGPGQPELNLGHRGLQVAGPAVAHLRHGVQPYRVDVG